MNTGSKTIFRSLSHRNYRLWFFGHGVSEIGTWMQTMAQQVLIYRLTGSASALGLINFVAVIPLVPFALWGGSLSDRVPKQKLLAITQILMLVQSVILTVLTWTGNIEIWHLYVLSFLLGAIKAMDTPARHSFVVELVEGREDLTNAIGLNSAIHHGARTLGPSIAGIVIATQGEVAAFFINSISFVAVIVSLLMMKDLPKLVVDSKQKLKGISHLTGGIIYIKSQNTVLVMMSLVAVSSFLSKPYKTLMPVFADNMLKESAMPVIDVICRQENPRLNCQVPEALPLGLLMSAIGLGALIGAIIVASLSEKARRGWFLIMGNLCFSACLLIFVNVKSLLISLIVIFLVGFFNVLQNSLANTLVQISAPDDLRGRVMSIYSLISRGMSRMGGLQAGLFADQFGASLSVGAGALVSLLYGVLIAFRFKPLRNME